MTSSVGGVVAAMVAAGEAVAAMVAVGGVVAASGAVAVGGAALVVGVASSPQARAKMPTSRISLKYYRLLTRFRIRLIFSQPRSRIEL